MEKGSKTTAKERIQTKDMDETELRNAVQLLADRLGFYFEREITPDYSVLWMHENG